MGRKQQKLWLAVLAVFLLVTSCGGTKFGVSNDEILLGTWAPLTGDYSTAGNIALAMEAYFKSVNEAGGVNGRQIRLIIKDDQYDPSKTKTAVNELLKDDGVFAVVGGVGTANCLAVKDAIQIGNIPWVNPNSSSPVWTMPVHAYTFSVTPNGTRAARILARYAFEEMEAKKMAIVTQKDSFGSLGQEGVRQSLRRLDKEISETIVVPLSQTDFTAEVEKLKEAEIDTVLLWSVPELGARFVNAMTAAEFTPKILGSNVLADPIMFSIAGEAWNGAVVASSKPASDSDAPGVVRAREILAKYAPDLPFGELTMGGLLGAELMTEALRRAGPDLKRISILTSLESMQAWDDNLLGHPISFSEDSHLGFDAFMLKRAEAGGYVAVTDWLEE